MFKVGDRVVSVCEECEYCEVGTVVAVSARPYLYPVTVHFDYWAELGFYPEDCSFEHHELVALLPDAKDYRVDAGPPTL